MDVNLSGKSIFITGGTGTLGRAFVARALNEGARVFFTYHRQAEEAEALQKKGAIGFQLDLSKRSEIEGFKKKLQEHTRHLDALIHNAAIVSDHTLQNLSEQDWDRVLEVDLSAVYFLTKKLLSFLFKNPGSKILTVISRAGLKGGFGQANYAAAKGGLIAWTKSLAQELGKKGILVNALNPGFMDSPMTRSIPPEVYQKNIDESILKTESDPEIVSRFMVYLLSDHFQNVSGQIFHLDCRRTV